MPERPLSSRPFTGSRAGTAPRSPGAFTFAWSVTRVEDTSTDAWSIRCRRPRSPAPGGDQSEPTATDQTSLEQEESMPDIAFLAVGIGSFVLFYLTLEFLRKV